MTELVPYMCVFCDVEVMLSCTDSGVCRRIIALPIKHDHPVPACTCHSGYPRCQQSSSNSCGKRAAADQSTQNWLWSLWGDAMVTTQWWAWRKHPEAPTSEVHHYTHFTALFIVRFAPTYVVVDVTSLSTILRCWKRLHMLPLYLTFGAIENPDPQCLPGGPR